MTRNEYQRDMNIRNNKRNKELKRLRIRIQELVKENQELKNRLYPLKEKK